MTLEQQWILYVTVCEFLGVFVKRKMKMDIVSNTDNLDTLEHLI